MTKPEPSIRLATTKDLGGILALLTLMADEFPVGEVDEIKAISQVRHIVENGLALVVEKEGQIVASVGLVAEEWFHSKDMYLTDYWLFVHPRYRKSRAANMLLKGIKDLAMKTKLPTFVAIRTFNQASRKNALYRRYFKPVGEIFFVGTLPKEA